MGQFKRAFVLIIATVVSLVVVATPSFADESSRVLVENSWRFQDGQSITLEEDSEDVGISAYSLSRLPDGVTAQGIDVSEHQGDINWDAVKASGVDFAILRVGFGAPSFGGRTDYQFQRNISECERLGIPYGIYLYSYAWDDGQAADEAAFVISNIAGHSPQLPIYYDLEDNSIIADGRQGGIASRASVFCNRIINAGYKVGIYANLNWFNNILTDPVFNSPSWDHWIAQYNYQCDYAGKYGFWQYASDGSVDGISGSVDMNYAYITIESNEKKWDRADELAAAHSSDLPDGTYTVASLVSGSTVFDAGMGGQVERLPAPGVRVQRDRRPGLAGHPRRGLRRAEVRPLRPGRGLPLVVDGQRHAPAALLVQRDAGPEMDRRQGRGRLLLAAVRQRPLGLHRPARLEDERRQPAPALRRQRYRRAVLEFKIEALALV